MLRSKIRKIILNKDNHPHLKKITRLLIFIGILWIMSFPYIARNVFTSENALNGQFLETQFNNDHAAYTNYKQLQERIKLLEPSNFKELIFERIGQKAEIYIQELKTKKDKFNIYAYLRSPRGYGSECNILAFPINYKASVVTGLAFAEAWIRRQPKWHSKDVILLFYEELDYAFGVKEFLENYHYQEVQVGSSFKTSSYNDSFFNTKIEGRCGYLRQGYAFVLNDYDYTKFSLIIDGINAQFSDIDFYDATKDGVEKQSWKFDFSLPYYFQKNPYLSEMIKMGTQFREYFLQGLEQIMTLFDMHVNSKGSILQMAESIKNQYIGRPHFPHSHMIEYGIHAITIKGTTDSKQKQINDREKVLNTFGLIEHLIRINDQLDEQLHAGSYFYMLMSKTTFLTNTVFVYPLVLIFVGYFFSQLLDYYEYESDENMLPSILFIISTYCLGFFFMIVPKFYLEYLGINNIKSDFCLADQAIKMQVASFTWITILSVSFIFLVIVKLLQSKEKHQRLWFTIQSHFNWLNQVLSGALVVYQFSESFLITLFIFPLIHNAVHLRGVSLFQAIKSIVLILLILAMDVLLLFGTFIGSKSQEGPVEIARNLTKEAILDYECAGSNVWIFFCLHIIPTFIVLIKILTN